MLAQPNWTSPVSASVKAFAETKGIDAKRLLREVGLESSTGHEKLSSNQAKVLSDALGGSVSFWINRSRIAEIQHARASGNIATSEIDWVRSFPYSYISSRNPDFGASRSPKARLNALLEYFAISDSVEFEQNYSGLIQAIAFRKSESFETLEASTLVWLTEAIRQTAHVEVSTFRPSSIDEIISECRGSMRLEHPKSFVPELQRILSKAGAKLAIVPTPPKCAASGAVFFFEGTPHILLSFRYRNDSQFWFTLFHELGHCKLHSEELLLLEGIESDYQKDMEAEADIFAEKILFGNISFDELAEISSRRTWFKRAMGVKRVAKRESLPPGLIVGRMQHLGLISHSHMNKLKHFYQWVDIPNP